MPSYTLYYFNGRGRAEICRMLFAAASVQYTDKRIEFSEWNTFRNKMPASMLPVLEIDGKTHIPQSMAIARYLAREFGFYGRNSIEMARIDYICDSLYELFHDYMRMYHEKDGRLYASMQMENRQKPEVELRQRYMETCRRILPFLERTILIYDGGNQYFMGDQISLADFMCAAALENPLQDNSGLLSSCPKLQALRNRVAAHPKIAAYLKKRENTDF